MKTNEHSSYNLASEELPRKDAGGMSLNVEVNTGLRPRQSSLPHEAARPHPRKGIFAQTRNWLEKWWSPDPRRAERKLIENLVAYYWTGSAPVPQGVRDISPEGLYLLTEDRWYPKTIVLLTLQRTDLDEGDDRRSIRVYATAVRWDSDGVGLQFAWPGKSEMPGFNHLKIASASPSEMQTFLDGLHDGTSMAVQLSSDSVLDQDCQRARVGG